MKHIIRLLVFILCIFSGAVSVYADYEKIKIAVLPFNLQGENFETEDMGMIVSEWLITAFVKDGRFEVVERKLLGQIMEEQQMAEAGLVSQETATEIGRLLGVKVIISGSVMKLREVIEVNSRIIDVTSASIVTAENVRSRNVNNLQPLVIEMADKIIKNFPLEGYIANRDQANVVIDLGELAGVKPGMKFMVYREGEVVRHPKTDEILYVKQIKKGMVKIVSVQRKISEGVIVEEVPGDSIEYGDYVKSMNDLTVRIVQQEAAIPDTYQQRNSYQAAPIEPARKKVAVTPKKEMIKARPQSTLSSEVQGYLELLKGSDSKQVRWAAKKLYKTQPYEEEMLREVNSVLLQGYNSKLEDKQHIDAMAWLCKLLANSKERQYKATVQEVIDNTESPKIKKHAQKAITLF